MWLSGGSSVMQEGSKGTRFWEITVHHQLQCFNVGINLIMVYTMVYTRFELEVWVDITP